MATTDERPPVWIGHVVMRSDRVRESCEFLIELGMRPIEQKDEFAVLELRGGTHLVLLHDESTPKGEVAFDLMVEDLEATHERLKGRRLAPSAIEPGEIHRSFTVRDPSGQQIKFNSTHVSELPV